MDQTTTWQRCAGCGGKNAHPARLCEFCARLLARAVVEPPTQRRHRMSLSLPTVVLGLVLLSAMLLSLVHTLATS